MPWKYSDPSLWEAAVTSEDFPIWDISRAYLDWMKHSDYSLLEHKETHKLVSVLQTKRGNAAYAKAQRKRLEPINEALSNLELDYIPEWDNRSRFRYTRALFITLGTKPTAGYTIPEAWLNLKGHESALNSFNSQMKRIFSSYHGKEVHYATHARREAYGNGYPHIHMIVLLDSYVKTELKQSKKADKHGRRNWCWRVADEDYNMIVKPLKDAWSRYHIPDSFVDIQCIVNGSITDDASGKNCNVMGYLMKYVTKDVQIDNEKAVYTHAMMKFFGMRDIFSKSFQKMIGLMPENNEDVRHDITITEFKQRIKTTKKRIRQTRRKIEELEQYKLYFGYLLSSKKTELEEEQRNLIELEEHLAYLQEELKKLQPDKLSEWEYKQTVTLCTMHDITNYFLWLEEFNSNPNAYSAYHQDFISTIAHLPFSASNLSKLQESTV